MSRERHGPGTVTTCVQYCTILVAVWTMKRAKDHPRPRRRSHVRRRRTSRPLSQIRDASGTLLQVTWILNLNNISSCYTFTNRHKQDSVPLLPSAILAIGANKDPTSSHSRGWECLKVQRQLGDRTQGWDRRHRHQPTQVSL